MTTLLWHQSFYFEKSFPSYEIHPHSFLFPLSLSIHPHQISYIFLLLQSHHLLYNFDSVLYFVSIACLLYMIIRRMLENNNDSRRYCFRICHNFRTSCVTTTTSFRMRPVHFMTTLNSKQNAKVLETKHLITIDCAWYLGISRESEETLACQPLTVVLKKEQTSTYWISKITLLHIC